MVGDGESCASEAAVDEGGAVLDVPQTAAESAFEMLVVGEGDVGQWARRKRDHTPSTGFRSGA